MRARPTVRLIACAAAGAAFLCVPAPAGSAAAPSEPAPACIVLHESWRYDTAESRCATTVAVQVVYQDGTRGLCHPVPPGDVTTIGAGYLGEHGRADHLAVCF